MPVKSFKERKGPILWDKDTGYHHHGKFLPLLKSFILLEINVLDLEMVSLKAAVGLLLRGKPFLEFRKENPNIGASDRILESLQQPSEGTVRSISGLFALLQKCLHWCEEVAELQLGQESSNLY